jgi:hypothetical protein
MHTTPCTTLHHPTLHRTVLVPSTSNRILITPVTTVCVPVHTSAAWFLAPADTGTDSVYPNLYLCLCVCPYPYSYPYPAYKSTLWPTCQRANPILTNSSVEAVACPQKNLKTLHSAYLVILFHHTEGFVPLILPVPLPLSVPHILPSRCSTISPYRRQRVWSSLINTIEIDVQCILLEVLIHRHL